MEAWILPTLVLTYPFAIIGAFFVMREWIMPKIRARRGYVRIYRLTPSGYLKRFWAKPEYEAGSMFGDTGYIINLKNEKLQFIDNPNVTFFNGSVKSALYDAEGNQISIQELRKYSPALSGKILDSLATRTWNAAKAAAFGEKRNLTIFILVAAGISLITLMLVLGMMNKIDSLIGAIDSLKGVVASAKMNPA